MRLDDSSDERKRTTRVVFVDDDPLVTRSLRRTLAGRSLPWEVHFCETGASALDRLDRDPCAVIVSDMTMPGMDGRELLDQVHAAHPEVARIILSGIPSPTNGPSVPGAHLCLSKPFDPEMLVQAIARGVELHALLIRPCLRAAFGPGLPRPLPACAAVTRALARERSSIWEIMDILEGHPGVSSRLSRISSYSPPEARRPRSKLVSYVAGIEPCALRGLVLLAELTEMIARNPAMSGTFSVDAYERRAIGAAYLAARIVGRRSAADRAFVAGLFHDIGELTLAATAPQALVGLRKETDPEGRSLEANEPWPLGFSRAEAGAFALGRFGFPLETIEAVLGRHETSEGEGTGLDVSRAAYVAGVLSRDSDAPVGPGVMKGLDPERLGPAHDPRRVEQWRRVARQLTGGATA